MANKTFAAQKQIQIAILALGLFLTFAGFAQAEPFRVGVIAPLTGPLGDYGVALQRGIEVALGSSSGNARVKFKYEDTPYDAKSAVVAFQKLRLVDKVDLIYVWGIVFCKSVAPLADTFEMPTVGQCIDPESSRGKKFFIRFQSTSTAHMKVQTEKLHTRGVKRVSLVVADNAYLIEMQRALSANLGPLELSHSEIVPTTEMDFRGLISRMKRSQTEAVGVFLLPGQISAFFKQAAVMKLKAITFGTNLFESQSEIAAASGTMEGALFVANRVAPWFESAVLERHTEATQLSFAALAHDFASLLNGLTVKGALSRTNILERVKDVNFGQGAAAGPFELKNSEEEGTFFDFELVERSVPIMRAKF